MFARAIPSLNTPYTCLSTDIKPTGGIPVGSKLLELDTNKIYHFDGTAWREWRVPVGQITLEAGQVDINLEFVEEGDVL